QHWYTDCFILNPRHPARPKTYQPAAEAVRKVEEARKDSKINARIKAALERWLTRQPQSNGSLRVDDGEPPANTDTFVISTGPMLKPLHDGHDIVFVLTILDIAVPLSLGLSIPGPETLARFYNICLQPTTAIDD
ncbi:hypothetical protein PtrEW13061_012021, partial [Pyrenophora tritici-repentis]